MIPEISYPNVLVPVAFPTDPLVDKTSVMSKFDNGTGLQVLHLKEDIIKPDVLKLINDRNLSIDKVDVWRWNLSMTKDQPPHTDGGYGDTKGRKAGLNWSLAFDNSSIDFYDIAYGTPRFETIEDRSHTFWKMTEGTKPLVSWRNKYPSVINTQTPHAITGPDGEFRYSMTIKFVGNPTFDEVIANLWDLRLDTDCWPLKITAEEIEIVKQEVINLEKLPNVVQNVGEKIASYKLPIVPDSLLVKTLEKYCKRKFKSFRIFHMQPGVRAEMHVDYDQWLKIIPGYALNFPLFGCEDSSVEFFRNLGNQETKSHEKSGVGGYLYPTDLNKVFLNHILYMLEPHLIRVNVPHLVDNFSTHERKILSIRFFEEVDDLPSNII